MPVKLEVNLKKQKSSWVLNEMLIVPQSNYKTPTQQMISHVEREANTLHEINQHMTDTVYTSGSPQNMIDYTQNIAVILTKNLIRMS